MKHTAGLGRQWAEPHRVPHGHVRGQQLLLQRHRVLHLPASPCPHVPRAQVIQPGLHGWVTPGQYAFPFTFVVPAGVPGTFSIQRGDAKGNVSYRIRGHCRVKGMFKSDLRSFQVICMHAATMQIITLPQFMHVTERFPTQLITPRAQQSTQAINCCCCISRGHAFMEVYLDKVCYVMWYGK